MRPYLILAMLCAFAIGCGDESVEVEAPAPSSRAKQLLEATAESGQPLGSGQQELQEQFEQIKAADPAKGEQLLKDLDELAGMSSSAKIKAKAKTMAAEL